jgi:hypothetical protein
MSALTVVYLESTRNVLAALTRAAPPGVGEAVKALVGTSLPVRAVGLTTTHFAFPASLLAAVTVDDTLPSVVIDPQAFQVTDDPQDKTLHEVEPYPPATPSSPAVTVTLDTSNGAVVTLQNVTTTTSLSAVVVLQKVTTPPQAARILTPVTVTGSLSGTTVAPASGFLAGETWEFSAFVRGMPPNAISQAL